MNKSLRTGVRGAVAIVVLTLGSAAVLAGVAGRSPDQTSANPTAALAADSLLEGYRHVEVASVSDAVEQISGR